MKKRILSFVCAVLLMMNLSGGALAAEPRASYYFSATEVYASPVSNSGILIEIEVTATHTMQKVGATDVYIYEQQSDGDYEIVYTYTSDDYPELQWSNNAFYMGSVTYQGTEGVKYYATCALYCKDSSGSETKFFNTNIVTATDNP